VPQPRYLLDDLQTLAAQGRYLLANRRAERNALSLDWGDAQFKAFIAGLRSSHYKGMRRALSIYDGRATIDADKYCARFDEENLRMTPDRRCCEFFVELAIRQHGSEDALLIISFHLSSQP